MLRLKVHIQTMMCDYSDKRAVMAKFRRSFLEGVGSVVSLQGSYLQLPLGSVMTDAAKLRSDWEAVGRELREAYNTEISTTHSSAYGKRNKRKQ